MRQQDLPHQVVEPLGVLLQLRPLGGDGVEHVLRSLLYHLVGCRIGGRDILRRRHREEEDRCDEEFGTHHVAPGAVALEKNWPISFSSTSADCVYWMLLPFLRKVS